MQKARSSYINGDTKFEIGGQEVCFLGQRNVLSTARGIDMAKLLIFVSAADLVILCFGTDGP